MENNDKIEELQSRIDYLNSQLSYYKGKCEVYEKYAEWTRKENDDEQN